MKILIISEYYPTTENGDARGGMELRAFELSRRISNRHSVTVITSKEKNQVTNQLISGVSVQRVGKMRSYVASGGYIDRIIFQVMAFYHALRTDFDLVEGSGFFAWAPAYGASLLKRKRRVLIFADDICDYLENGSMFVRSAMFLYQKWILKRKWDMLISISQTSWKKISANIKKTNLSIIYCGIDQKSIDSINLSKIPNRIICVSRLVKYKRVEDLIRACGMLSSKKIDFQLCIVGSGEEEKNLKLLTRDLGIYKKVKFYGFIKRHLKVLELVKSSSIFCSPSVVEGFGIAVLESLAAGTPAVVSDLPIYHEISKGLGTIYFRARDSVDLAQKLELLLVKTKYRNELGKKGKQIAAKYDWDVISRKVESTYENLCHY